MGQTPFKHSCSRHWPSDSEEQNTGKKLNFLQRVLGMKFSSLSGTTLEAISDSISEFSPVRECRKLEEVCGVAYTDSILRGHVVRGKRLKEELRQTDPKQLLSRCSEKTPIVALVQELVGWRSL